LSQCELKHYFKQLQQNSSFNRYFKRKKNLAGKKVDRPGIEPVSRQNKCECDHFSALFACANKAIVRNKRNHINNKAGGKCHPSVTLSFSKTKLSLVDAIILERNPKQLEILRVSLTHLVDIATSTRHLSESKLGR